MDISLLYTDHLALQVGEYGKVRAAIVVSKQMIWPIVAFHGL